jgi:hypothetical protein
VIGYDIREGNHEYLVGTQTLPLDERSAKIPTFGEEKGEDER